ncbi:hypothetical protein GCM10009719_31740 [Nocardioides kribbensis]|uniref:anti-sigma factor domain-containing protein n=1 Tax=Nocardioides kribbensis TaxID=305517 RepID=UPI0031D05DDD
MTPRRPDLPGRPGTPGPPPDGQDHPDLQALLRAELDNAHVLAVGDHLAGCPQCRAELAEQAVGHALLTRAARTLTARPGTAGGAGGAGAVGGRAAGGTPGAAGPAGRPPRGGRPAPRTPATAGGTASMPEPPPLVVSSRPRGRRPLLALAAALAVVAAGVGAAGGWALAGSGPDATGSLPAAGGAPQTPSASPTGSPDGGPTGPSTGPEPRPVGADLAPLERRFRDSAGAVELVDVPGGTRVTITASGLPEPRRGEFYEAWLLDPATNKMLPLGTLGPDGSAVVELPAGLVSAYAAVDVSLEPDDGDPAHSVTSALRGAYAGPTRA